MGKFIDLTGQTFGKISVLNRVENYILPNGKPRTMWRCKCACGNEFTTSSQSLIQKHTVSCGCVGKEKRMKARNKNNDLTGMRFGRLLVLNRELNRGNKTMWKCKCDCGNETIVYRSGLTSGRTKSCGCLRVEKTIKRETLDISGQKYGLLTAIKPVGKIRYGNTMCSQWECICDCGNKKITTLNHLRTGHTFSCGCLKQSKQEWEVSKVLDELHVNYCPEHSFSELAGINNRLLRFDFAIFENGNLKALLEIQGMQHYKEIKWHSFGESQRSRTDPQKRAFCLSKHIPLYEIKYNENTVFECLKMLTEIFCCHVNTVPSSAFAERV